MMKINQVAYLADSESIKTVTLVTLFVSLEPLPNGVNSNKYNRCWAKLKPASRPTRSKPIIFRSTRTLTYFELSLVSFIFSGASDHRNYVRVRTQARDYSDSPTKTNHCKSSNSIRGSFE